MAAFYLFCPGSLLSKKHKSKSSEFNIFEFIRVFMNTPFLCLEEKLKFDRNKTVIVDPLYETIPARTRYSQDNRGKHTYVHTGKLPPSLLNSSTNTACVLSNYSPPAGDHQTIGVLSGQTVFVVQQEKDWSYVIDEHNQLGYVPSDILSAVEVENSNSSVNTSLLELGVKSDSPKIVSSWTVVTQTNLNAFGGDSVSTSQVVTVQFLDTSIHTGLPGNNCSINI